MKTSVLSFAVGFGLTAVGLVIVNGCRTKDNTGSTQFVAGGTEYSTLAGYKTVTTTEGGTTIQSVSPVYSSTTTENSISGASWVKDLSKSASIGIKAFGGTSEERSSSSRKHSAEQILAGYKTTTQTLTGYTVHCDGNGGAIPKCGDGNRYLSTSGNHIAGEARCSRRVEQPKMKRPSVGTERYAEFIENEFVAVASEPLSTFGLDVDTASYTTMRRYLTDNKHLPPKDSVRIEEFVNYFSYDYPEPQGDVPIAVDCELAACPWAKEHKLLRVGVQAKRVAKDKLPPANLVFLIDVSGSMAGNGGLEMAKPAIGLLTDQLRDNDYVSIVTYADDAKVRLESTGGRDKARIRSVVESLSAGGCTAGGAGLQLAYDEADKHFCKDGNNRIILITDGDFNVGIRDPKELEEFIMKKREGGVFLSVLGVGHGNYQDAMMKKLANVGNGNYAFLDGLLEAKKILMTEFGGTMYTIAKDVKLQLEFNPAQVTSYRLLGYENRKLAAQDFNDDKKDAGELGAGHTMTALYELVPAGATNAVATVDPLKYQKSMPIVSKELLTVKLRYKEPNGGKSKLIETPVVADDITRLWWPSEDWRFSSAVAEFALLLKDSKFKGNASMKELIARAKESKGKDENGYRAEFIRLAEQAELFQRTKCRQRSDENCYHTQTVSPVY